MTLAEDQTLDVRVGSLEITALKWIKWKCRYNDAISVSLTAVKNNCREQIIQFGGRQLGPIPAGG